MKVSKSFKMWESYYERSKNLIHFKALLKVADKSYLFKENTLPYDDLSWNIMPPHGFLEKDYRIVLNELNGDNNLSEELVLQSKTRLVLALESGINFKEWLVFFGNDLSLVFARSLVDGKYEEFGIDFENLAKDALACGVLTKDEFFGVALMRGSVLGKRYSEPKKEKELENLVKANSLKVTIQEKMYKYI